MCPDAQSPSTDLSKGSGVMLTENGLDNSTNHLSASKARFTCRTFTLSSPNRPKVGNSVYLSIIVLTWLVGTERARAMRSTCQMAALVEICASSPEADVVTKSCGTGPCCVGLAARRSAMRALTASDSAGLSGPRLEPPEAKP